MPNEMLMPTFLTEEVARKATDHVLTVAQNMGADMLGRMMCHIVILVPAVEEGPGDSYQKLLDSPIKPSLLYEVSLGDPSKWPRDFKGIARCKALQLWRGQNNGQTDCIPHLLFSGYTPFWGGVNRYGIVGACSGFKPYFDRMFSGMTVDMCVAYAYNEWDKIQTNFNGSFLP